MLLELDNLSGGYGGIDIVKNVVCTADKGEILCLVGPNGCGKTTLFRLILGILKNTGGQVRIDGKSINAMKHNELASCIAYIPQQHTPIFAYTVLDIVIMGRARHFAFYEVPKTVDRDIAFAALEKLKIINLANEKYTSLSGGQRQLVLIARALCQSAKIFVMDEPASNLDYANQLLLLNVTAELADSGYCVIMSTHSPEHPLLIGHKVMLMREGRTVAFGKPADVFRPDILEKVYEIEMDVVSVTDRYGIRRTICLPVKNTKKEI